MANISTTVDVDFDPDDFIEEISDTKLLGELKRRLNDEDIEKDEIYKLLDKPYVNPGWASICETLDLNVFSSEDDVLEKVREAFKYKNT